MRGCLRFSVRNLNPKSKPMKPKTKPSDVVLSHLANLDRAKAHEANVHAAIQFARDFGHPCNDAGDVLARLCEVQRNLMSAVMMFSLAITEKERCRIKAMAHASMLSDRHSVAHYMEGGVMPGMWLEADEESFRQMCREAFLPKEE